LFKENISQNNNPQQQFLKSRLFVEKISDRKFQFSWRLALKFGNNPFFSHPWTENSTNAVYLILCLTELE